MNYGELKTTIASYSHRTDLTSVIPTFISVAQQRINEMARTRYQLTTGAETFTTNPMALPADFLEMREVSRDQNSGRVVLNSVGRHMLALYIGPTGARPQVYSIDGRFIEIAPGGDQENVYYIYYASEPAFSDDSDTSALLTALPSLYIQGALMELYDYTDNSKKQQEAAQKFTMDVETANRASAMSEASESPQMGGASTVL